MVKTIASADASLRASQLELDLTAAAAAGAPTASPTTTPRYLGRWHTDALISRNGFKNKSLSNWSYNPVVGCSHGCVWCYAADATRGTHDRLRHLGVVDPAAAWGNYAYVRRWDADEARQSLEKALAIDPADLERDGNRAVMISTTTDAYQVIGAVPGSPALRQRVQDELDHSRRSMLEVIRDHSDLRVRILTRSPLVVSDLDLLKEFGDRCMVGMSLPTLDDRLCRRYEPHAPGPSQRLDALRAVHEAGLGVYVALAPVPPESTYEDILRTMIAVAELAPVTVYVEPINVHRSTFARMQNELSAGGQSWPAAKTFELENWPAYAMRVLRGAEVAAREVGLPPSVLHLWPPLELESRVVWERARRHFDVGDYDEHLAWLDRWWRRISDWPGEKKGRSL